MNRDSNIYTITYASVMVVAVAVLLAFTAQSLRSFQKKNEDNDKRRQILRSINVVATDAETEAKYNELIKESFVVNAKGQKIDGNAFTINASKMKSDNSFPVYVATVGGSTKYIVAMHGAGLWGPIWGYISFDEDKNTVFGSDFSHQGETPGLGAEIATPKFAGRFTGKHVFKNNAFRSISIVKPGNAVSDGDYVDGISGGTITSKGVDRMIRDSLEGYIEFLNAK